MGTWYYLIWGGVSLLTLFYLFRLFQTRSSFRYLSVSFRLFFLSLLLYLLQFSSLPSFSQQLPLLVLVDTSLSMRTFFKEPKAFPVAVQEIVPDSVSQIIAQEFPEHQPYFYNWFPEQKVHRESITSWSHQSPLYQQLQKFIQTFQHSGKIEVILITEGNNTDGSLSKSLERMLQESKIQLHVIHPTPQQKVDLSIQKIGNPEVVFLHEPISMPVSVRSLVQQPHRSELTLTDGDSILDKQILEFPSGSSTQEVQLHWIPRKKGDTLLSLRLLPLDGEENLYNNEAYLPLSVRANRLKILHIAGRPSWDVRQLRRLLKEIPEMDIIAFFILRDPYVDSQEIPEAELALIQFPVQELFLVELFKFDSVIFHNFAIRRYLQNPEFQQSFQKYLAQGKRIIVIGGDQTVENQGYHELFLDRQNATQLKLQFYHVPDWELSTTPLLPSRLAQEQASFQGIPQSEDSQPPLLQRTPFQLGRVDWIQETASWQWNHTNWNTTDLRFAMFWQTLLYQPRYEQQKVFREFRQNRPYHVNQQIAGHLSVSTESTKVFLEIRDQQTDLLIEEQNLIVIDQVAYVELPSLRPGHYELQLSCRCNDMKDLVHPIMIVDEWMELHNTSANMKWLQQITYRTGGRMYSVN